MVLDLILSYVFGFLLSLPGLFAGLLGLLLFITLPVIPRVSGVFHSFANFHLWNATAMLKRAAVVVSEHGELLLKRMTFDDIGVEKISFDDDVKEFEDPANASHYWMGIRFALADEVHGVIFDPRHSMLGAKVSDARERGINSVLATDAEYEEFQIHEWKKALIELPRDVYQSVRLSDVRHLIDGGERAEYPARVEKMYKYSRDPFKTGTATTSLIMIVVAMIAPFAAMWLLATQTSGGSGGSSSVSFGTLALLMSLTSIPKRIAAINWLDIFKRIIIVSILPGLFGAMWYFVNPLFAIYFFVTLGAGFWLFPIMVQVFKASNIISGAIGPLLMRTGLKGYRRPVFTWTPNAYRLREADDLDNFSWDDADIYGLCGSLVAFTFQPNEESWGAEVVDAQKMENKAETIADGGQPSAPESNIPAGYRRVPDLVRGEIFAGFIPRRLKPSENYYLNSGIAFSAFNESATGEKSLRRLTKAKDKFGGEGGLSDKSVAYAMIICGIISFGTGVFVFFL